MKRNPKTSLLRAIQTAFKSVVSNDNKHPSSVPQNNSRRKFIGNTVIAGATIFANKAFANDGYFKSVASIEPPYKIGILGAGIAGLHAAYILKQSNIEATVYESSGRTGGRMYTAKNMLAPGITTELGGEFIDSNHKDVLNLAKEFDLQLLDTELDKDLIKQVFYFGGKKFIVADLENALRPFVASIKQDIDSLPETITYQNYGSAAKWDAISITDYLKLKGISGWLYDMFCVAFTTEYGLDANEQSAINLLWLLVPEKIGEELFGESDERYKIKGGNQLIVDELAKRVGLIKTNHTITAIHSNAKGFSVHFSNQEVKEFDYLICTIPFSVLRNINLQIDGMSNVKKKSIAELGYGKNAKMFAGFKKRYWRKAGATGQLFSDMPLQLGWDSSQLQKGNAGGFTIFTGGKNSDTMIDSPVPKKVKEYLVQLDKIFPGAAKNYNGKNGIFFWPTHPHTLGSYACYKTGQWTTIAGAEIEPVGNLFFAGEHCSADFQGFMNGGAETGRRAAEEIIKKIKNKG